MLSLEMNVGYKTNHMSVRAYLNTLLSQRGSISPVERSNMILNCFHHLNPIIIIMIIHYKTSKEKNSWANRNKGYPVGMNLYWVFVLFLVVYHTIDYCLREDVTYISYISYQSCFTDSGVCHPYSLESFSASPRRAAVCISFLGIQPTF